MKTIFIIKFLIKSYQILKNATTEFYLKLRKNYKTSHKQFVLKYIKKFKYQKTIFIK
jgi:hypothetical protein